ncbi:DUF4931 domain-containing protein [Candidatus Woesearchaeota archaeon]|nr:DUF4931 domain-containing protein [Candidatus Woesearchaeota archaeon]
MIRKDYILDRWVYYATSRKKRPHELKSIEVKNEIKQCLFCPSNEKLTPQEIGRVEYKGGWKIRWFLNKYPAVDDNKEVLFKQKKYISEGVAYGIHEIIVETNHHKSQLADLPIQHICELFKVFKLRIRELSKLKNIKYVEIFKNHGKDAGTSLVHSHTQVVALAQIPSLVNEESAVVKKYKKCPYCEIIKLESKSKRKIFETKNVIAFAPFASRFNYEAWIFTKQHKKTLEELAENEIEDIALALKRILSKLRKISASYNFFIHYSPKNEDLHFHIEVTPRTATWGGFELGTDFTINSAARFYKVV